MNVLDLLKECGYGDIAVPLKRLVGSCRGVDSVDALRAHGFGDLADRLIKLRDDEDSLGRSR